MIPGANNCVQATPGYASSLFLSHWPGAPDAERSSRHEVAFNTAWRDRFPDQALRVAAGIPRKHASGGLGRVATTARGMEPSRQCSKPGSLRLGAS
jgi:hypothetical protein